MLHGCTCGLVSLIVHACTCVCFYDSVPKESGAVKKPTNDDESSFNKEEVGDCESNDSTNQPSEGQFYCADLFLSACCWNECIQSIIHSRI